MARRIGGIIQFKADGQALQAKGSFTYNIGVPKRELVVGHDGVHGYKELPQAPRVEGTITDQAELDLQALLESNDVTIVLELANGKIFVLRNAVYVADGNVTTEEGEIEIMFEGESAEEISA